MFENMTSLLAFFYTSFHQSVLEHMCPMVFFNGLKEDLMVLRFLMVLRKGAGTCRKNISLGLSH